VQVGVLKTFFMDDLGLSEHGHRPRRASVGAFLEAAIQNLLLVPLFQNQAKAFIWCSLVVSVIRGLAEIKDALIYEHEMEREKWEHESYVDGEKIEFAGYAIELGVPRKDAQKLSELFTQYPQISVPYHLGMELGLAKPVSGRNIVRLMCFRLLGGILGGLIGRNLSCITMAFLAVSIGYFQLSHLKGLHKYFKLQVITAVVLVFLVVIVQN
jgi:hypothetical protein